MERTADEVKVLVDSGQLGNAVLAALPGMAVLVLDRELRIRQAAGQALERHGWMPERMEGRALSEIAAPELLADLEPHYRRALAGEAVRFDHRTADGLVYRNDIAPMRSNDEVVGGVLIARDITEAQAATDALAGSERRYRMLAEQFRAAFRHAPIGKAIVSLDGRCVMVNQALCEITGYRERDLLGASFAELAHPDDRDVDVDEIGRLVAGEIRTLRTEKRFVRADGTVVWTATSGSLVRDADGRPLHLIAQVQDIEEQHRHREREREQLERLRELDTLKDEFIGFVSHELRTPLTSIRGYMELLAEYGDNLTEEQRTFVDTVRRNGTRLNRLIEDLLAYFRVEEGKVDLEVGRVDLAALLEQAAESAGPAAVRKQLSLTTRLVDSAPVFGDEDRLAQVIDNLVSNAIKYTPEGGEIEAAVDLSGDDVVLTVSDTGIGIPEVERSRLFERFFRASTATERAIPGTGLGLAITKGLVEAHGGEITAEPRDRGTRFVVTLPLAELPALALG